MKVNQAKNQNNLKQVKGAFLVQIWKYCLQLVVTSLTLVQCTLKSHWNTTGCPSVHWDTTRRPSRYLHGTLEHHWKNLKSWNCPTLECHWRNPDYCSIHWNTTGRTVTTNTHPAHKVKQSSIHASLKWQDGWTTSRKWTGLCIFSFYLEFTTLQWMVVLFFKRVSTYTSPCACLGYSTIIVFIVCS